MGMEQVSSRTKAHFLQAHHRLFESTPSTIIQAYVPTFDLYSQVVQVLDNVLKKDILAVRS